jgi:hypothetical protein
MGKIDVENQFNKSIHPSGHQQADLSALRWVLMGAMGPESGWALGQGFGPICGLC